VADDKTEQLDKYAGNAVIILVEFDKPVDLQKLKTISGCHEVIHLHDCVYQIQTMQRLDIRKGVFDFAVANDLSVLSLSKQEQSIEDIFRQLTSE
jgi:ABC-2 type transport system ATP-binding protein